MDALESSLRRALEPLGFRVEASADRYTLKSAHGNFVVKGASGLSLSELEAVTGDITSGKPTTFVPLPHSATARALKTIKRKP